MGFKLVKINGGSTASVVQTNDATIEAVISNFIAYNVGGTTESFTLKSDGVVIISEEVPANGSYRLPDKFNIPVATELTIDTDTNVSATISVYVGAIDATGALTAVQQAVTDAGSQVALAEDQVALAAIEADRAENALPAGTIDDLSVATDKAFSAAKILEIANTDSTILTATGGETVITAPTYTVGNKQLVVAIEGNVQMLGTDYTETTSTSITLTSAMTEDEKILIQKV